MPSTPSKIKSASRSQAGNLEFKQDNLKDDLEADIRNSIKCSFDPILKSFLSLDLRDDDPEKRTLNDIQKTIEELQLKRYGGDLTRTEDTTSNGATSDNHAAAAELVETLSSATRTQVHADDKDDDTQFGSETEKELVRQRDTILDELLADALESVQAVTDNGEVIEKLKDFVMAYDKAESDRYGPFVLLCNNALLLLASCDSKRRFREKDGLDIRFHRNDPSNITSSYDDMQDLDRRPDVVITPLIAALRASSKDLEEDVKFDQSPKKSLQWSDFLSCVEFKVLKKGIPEEAIAKFWRPVRSAPVSEHINPNPNDPLEGVESPIATEGSGSKRVRDSVSIAENALPSKRQRQSGAATPTSLNSIPAASALENNFNLQKNMVENKTQQAINGRVQCASYALEMMSYNAGVHHAINLLFMDGHVWIWYYDRQGIIQSDGISIFENFDQFLILLFSFQRFRPEDWGIIRCLNPNFFHGVENQAREKNEQVPEPVVLNLQQDLSEPWVGDNQSGKKLTKVDVDMKSFLSYKPHCLSGRATSVVSAQGNDQDRQMVCKIYHPEVERRHEGATLQIIRKIAADEDESMLKHLPSILFYGDVPGCTTQRIRSMIKRRWKGHRTLRILGLKKLEKITTVDGADFIKAWLETVTCHAFLWKNYVEHGDPSLSNIMYDPETKCGVLSDFDLSLLQWEPRIIGTDRTGTVPFMAIELLNKQYWEGKIQRFYHHELESFIWILAYVCLLYDGKTRKKNAAVDSWRTSDYDKCRMAKRDFYSDFTGDRANQVQASYKPYWPLADKLLFDLHFCHLDHQKQKRISADNAPRLASERTWEIFNAALLSNLSPDSIPDQKDLLKRLTAQKPSFEPPDEATQQKLQAKFSTIIS